MARKTENKSQALWQENNPRGLGRIKRQIIIGKMIKKLDTNHKIISTYFIILILTVIALWTVKTLNISYPLTVVTKEAPTELSVVGTAKVDAVPDIASVPLGIVVRDTSSVEEAQSQINTVNNNIIEALDDLGIKKEDIKTSQYFINPNFNFEKERAISGYNGNATITVKVRDLKVLPKVISKSTEAGANQILGVNFSIDDPQEFQDRARDKAIENAKEQAKRLSKTLGIKLGKVVNIIESTSGGPISIQRSFQVESLSIEGPDIEPGSQTVTSTVTLFFERR